MRCVTFTSATERDGGHMETQKAQVPNNVILNNYYSPPLYQPSPSAANILEYSNEIKLTCYCAYALPVEREVNMSDSSK